MFCKMNSIVKYSYFITWAFNWCNMTITGLYVKRVTYIRRLKSLSHYIPHVLKVNINKMKLMLAQRTTLLIHFHWHWANTGPTLDFGRTPMLCQHHVRWPKGCWPNIGCQRQTDECADIGPTLGQHRNAIWVICINQSMPIFSIQTHKC